MLGMVNIKSRVGPKGQVVIPKPIRDSLGIHPGDDVFFDVDEGRGVFDKTDPETWVKEFTEALPKTTIPRDTDWDALHYEQIEQRMRRAGVL